MRKVSFVVPMVLALAACGGGETPDPNTPAKPPVATTSEVKPVVDANPVAPAKPELTAAQKQEATVKGFWEALNAHDAKKLASFYGEGASVTMAGDPDVLKGKDAIEKYMGQLFTGFPDMKVGASRVWTKGDVVIVEDVTTGTNTGEMMGMKATEKKIGFMGADVMWFNADGTIKEHHVYHDVGTIMSQLGVSKQKARPLASLPASPQMFASTGGAEEAKNLESSKAWMKAFETKKDTDFLGNLADNIEWDDMTQPETSKGKENAKKYFGMMLKAFPDMKATTSNSWAVGDFVISEGTMEGTQKGALGPIPATNKKVNMHGLDIVQYKDGKVVKGWSYGNSAEMMGQLGLLPKPAAAKTDAKADTSKTPAAKPAPDTAKTPAAKPAPDTAKAPTTPAAPAKK